MQKLKALYNKLKVQISGEPIWKGNQELTIKPVFFCDKQYFEVVGVFNVPYQRGLAASAIYEEVQMRVTREYLQLHIDKELQILSDAKSINIPELAQLNKELRDRLSWIVSPETIYKLASVVYFDENESPYEYNYQYAQEKIKRWKKYKVDDFFLQEPIKKFIPHSGLQNQDLITYIQTALKVENEQSENLLQQLSKISSTKDYYKIIKESQKKV